MDDPLAIGTILAAAPAQAQTYEPKLPSLPAGLRRLASGLQRLKIDPHIVEECLNHTAPKLQRVYQTYDYEPEKRAALARWAAHLDAVLTSKTTDNVVDIRQAAGA